MWSIQSPNFHLLLLPFRLSAELQEFPPHLLLQQGLQSTTTGNVQVTLEEVEQRRLGSPSNNMLDRITDDLNFLLNGSASEDMMTFTPAHLYPGKQKLPTIQENMVGISEDLEAAGGGGGGGTPLTNLSPGTEKE